MTAIPHPLDAVIEHEPAHAHEHQEIGFIKKHLFSTDHKTIGLQFLFLGLTFFVIAGLEAMLIRWQLGWPGQPVPVLGAYMQAQGAPGWDKGILPQDFYATAFTMHASLMIFFVIIPLLVGTFGNYLIPLKIGAADMAFPFLNGVAFWTAVPAGIIMTSSFFMPGGPAAAGWTSYPPLSALIPPEAGKGLFPYVPPASKFRQAMEILRLHDAGFTAGPLAPVAGTTGEYEVHYRGDAAKVLAAVRLVLPANQYFLVPGGQDGEVAGITLDQPASKAAVVVRNDGILTIRAGESAARQIVDGLVKRLNWQSGWGPMPLILNFAALFLCLSYLCAYCVRLGSGPLNLLVSLALATVGAVLLVRAEQYAVFDGQSAWFCSLFILGFSSILGAVNYLTTIVKLRCPGMTMFRLPLSIWSLFITSILVLLATPVLASALMLNLLDHHRLTSFFLPFNWTWSNQLQEASGGGYPLLHQHLFWFYSHPAVYIMILPAMGMVSDILAVGARKPVFGYRPMVYAMAGIAFLGFIVWAHHMFQSGLNPTLATTFAISTIFISVPSAIKTFNWLGTLWGGNIRFTAAMCNAIAFVAMFVIGGLSGIFMASTAVDVPIHDTYFIVAHIHYVLFGASAFGIFAAIYFWYPKMFGRMMNEKLGLAHFVLTFIAFNCTFFPMHILGIGGMPRRLYDLSSYASFAHFAPMNRFISISAFVMGAAQVLFAINFIGSWMWGRKAGRNPWLATTLEWETESPPPHGNFEKTPVVHHGPYEYSSPLVEEDWLPQTRYVDEAAQLAAVKH